MPRGAVTLCFDDGYRAVYDRVLPLLHELGLRAVLAVPVDSSALERAEGTPIAAWQRVCETDQHELAAHGVTHRALSILTDEELADELRRSREATGASALVYPGGAHDDRVVAAARPLFRAARTVRPGYATLPPRDWYRLPSFVSTRDNFQVWKWNLRALWAWVTNRWLIETHHNVTFGQGPWSTGHGKRHAIPLEALERHLRFLQRLPIRIATIRDVVHD